MVKNICAAMVISFVLQDICLQQKIILIMIINLWKRI